MAKNTMGKDMGELKTDVSELKTDFAVINNKITNIESFMKSMNKAISGNGQPGLVQKMEKQEEEFNTYVAQNNEWKGKKEGSDIAYKWISSTIFSIAMLVVAALAL